MVGRYIVEVVSEFFTKKLTQAAKKNPRSSRHLTCLGRPEIKLAAGIFFH